MLKLKFSSFGLIFAAVILALLVNGERVNSLGFDAFPGHRHGSGSDAIQFEDAVRKNSSVRLSLPSLMNGEEGQNQDFGLDNFQSRCKKLVSCIPEEIIKRCKSFGASEGCETDKLKCKNEDGCYVCQCCCKAGFYQVSSK